MIYSEFLLRIRKLINELMKLLHCQIVCVRATVISYSHELKYFNIEVRTEVEQTLIRNKYVFPSSFSSSHIMKITLECNKY